MLTFEADHALRRARSAITHAETFPYVSSIGGYRFVVSPRGRAAYNAALRTCLAAGHAVAAAGDNSTTAQYQELSALWFDVTPMASSLRVGHLERFARSPQARIAASRGRIAANTLGRGWEAALYTFEPAFVTAAHDRYLELVQPREMAHALETLQQAEDSFRVHGLAYAASATAGLIAQVANPGSARTDLAPFPREPGGPGLGF